MIILIIIMTLSILISIIFLIKIILDSINFDLRMNCKETIGERIGYFFIGLYFWILSINIDKTIKLYINYLNTDRFGYNIRMKFLNILHKKCENSKVENIKVENNASSCNQIQSFYFNKFKIKFYFYNHAHTIPYIKYIEKK